MNVRSDDRAVSPVVGAILVFGLIIAVIALIQVNAIPLEVQQTEFEHNQLAQEQVLALGEDVEDSATIGTVNAETVVLGTRYTAGFPFVSPGPAAGELRTESATVTITGARALDPETDDYWDGTTPRPFDTSRILYEPGYNQYRNAPVTVIGPEGTYNRFDREKAVVPLDGGLVNGNTITLVTVEGSLSGSRVGPKSVQTYPVASPMRVTRVTSTAADPIRIAITTGVDPERIRTLYAGEPNVTAVEDTPDGVALVLEPGTYDLRLGKVSLDSPGTDEPAAYVTNGSDVRGSLRTGETQTVTFRVWSTHNTPVADEPVTLQLTGPAVFEGSGVPDGAVTLERTTDEDGRVEATVRTTGVGEVQVVASVAGVQPVAANVPQPVVAAENLTVLDPVDTGSQNGSFDGVSEINPGEGANSVVLRNVRKSSQRSLELTFDNEAPLQGYRLARVRVSFYFDASGGQQGQASATLFSPPDGSSGATITVGGEFTDVASAFDPPERSFDLGPDDSTTPPDTDTLRIEFPGTLGNGDWFVLSTVWRETGQGSDEIIINYFINANP